MILTRKNRATARGHSAGKITRNRKISVTLPDKCFDILARQSELTGLSMAEVIRQFLPYGKENQ